MERQQLQNLLDWKRRQARCLMEVDTLTGQLEQAAGRGDQVSVSMVLAMRGEPLQQAQELEQSMQSYLFTLPEKDAIRGKELLDGKPAQCPEEERLAAQVASNRRAVEKIQEVDRRVSLQLGGRHSFYYRVRKSGSS